MSVLVLIQLDFKAFLIKYLGLNLPILRSLSTRIQESDEIICSLTSKNIYDSILYRLNRKAKVQVDGLLVTPKLTHQDIAGMIGSS